MGKNRCIWENKVYPIPNKSIYVGVCHASAQREHIACAARVASAPPDWELLDPYLTEHEAIKMRDIYSTVQTVPPNTVNSGIPLYYYN